jgi:DNA polymerase IIIc chi subunit
MIDSLARRASITCFELIDTRSTVKRLCQLEREQFLPHAILANKEERAGHTPVREHAEQALLYAIIASKS